MYGISLVNRGSRTILGPFWDHFGIFWDDFGTILVVMCPYSGPMASILDWKSPEVGR